MKSRTILRQAVFTPCGGYFLGLFVGVLMVDLRTGGASGLLLNDTLAIAVLITLVMASRAIWKLLEATRNERRTENNDEVI